MRKFDPDIHHRRSIRLRDFDYAREGAYFVTVCVHGRECLFGDVVGGQMRLNAAGRMIEEVWNSLPNRYPGVEIDVHMVMPDHFHGIIWIVGAGPCACPDSLPDRARSKPGHPQGGAPTMSLCDVVHRLKSLTTARYRHGVYDNHWPPFPGRLWQRNYYERIIRDDDELRQMRDYVVGNPGRWADGGGGSGEHGKSGADTRVCPYGK